MKFALKVTRGLEWKWFPRVDLIVDWFGGMEFNVHTGSVKLHLDVTRKN